MDYHNNSYKDIIHIEVGKCWRVQDRLNQSLHLLDTIYGKLKIILAVFDTSSSTGITY